MVTGPAKITENRYSDAKETFTCQSSPSRPAARLNWRVEVAGRVVATYEGENPVVSEAENGGRVTSASLSLNAREILANSNFARENQPDVMVECYASHPVLGDDFVAFAHMVEVLCE